MISYKHIGLVILVALSPVFLYAQIFELILAPLVPAKGVSTELLKDQGKAALFAREFPSRVSLGLVCLILAVASIAGLIYSIWLAYRGAGARIAAALGLVAVLAGAVSFVTNDHFDGRTGGVFSPFNSSENESTGERMRHIAQIPGGLDTVYDTDFQKEALASTGYIAALSALFGVAATAALALAINGVGFGAFYAGQKSSDDNLRRRWRQYRMILVFASLIFAFAVAVLQLFYQWPLTLIKDDEAVKIAKALVDSTVMFWAVLFSLTLLMTTLPAFIALRWDIDAAARTSGQTSKERKAWRDGLGLTVISRDALGGALAILSPVLTAPVMDAFGRVLDLVNFGN